MRPCAGERLLLAHHQRLLSGSTKISTYRSSCLWSLELDLAVLTIRLHAQPCPVQRRVRDDRRGGSSCSRGAIQHSRLVSDDVVDFVATVYEERQRMPREGKSSARDT